MSTDGTSGASSNSSISSSFSCTATISHQPIAMTLVMTSHWTAIGRATTRTVWQSKAGVGQRGARVRGELCERCAACMYRTCSSSCSLSASSSSLMAGSSAAEPLLTCAEDARMVRTNRTAPNRTAEVDGGRADGNSGAGTGRIAATA